MQHQSTFLQLNPRKGQNDWPQSDPVLLGFPFDLYGFVLGVSHGGPVLLVHLNGTIGLGYSFIFNTPHLVSGHVFLVCSHFRLKWHDRLPVRSFLKPDLVGANCRILDFNCDGSDWLGNPKVLNYSGRWSSFTILGTHLNCGWVYANDLDS